MPPYTLQTQRTSHLEFPHVGFVAQVAGLVRAREALRGFRYTHVVAARPDTAVLSPLVW